MQRSSFRQTFFYESGQALVLVLLSLSVVLTIVLFILSRSITDISISTEQADSVRAFSAAEAGIERALITGSGYSDVSIGNASYSVDVSDYSEGQNTFNYPSKLLSGNSMTNWFVSHNALGNMFCGAGYPCFTGNTLKVCWGNEGTSKSTATTPAIEISVYYENPVGSLANVKLARAVYDPNDARRASNSFAMPDPGICQIGGVNYAFQKTLYFSDLNIPSTTYNTQNGLLFAKVRMLYNNTGIGHIVGTSVAFAGNTTLPSQGLEIISTGSSGATGSESNRRVNVFRGWSEFPFSGLSIFSPYGLVK